MKERQAWYCLQVKLCDPCLSTLYVPWCEKALYKYSSFPFLSEVARLTISSKPSNLLNAFLHAPHFRLLLTAVRVYNKLYLLTYVLTYTYLRYLETDGRTYRTVSSTVAYSAHRGKNDYVALNVGGVERREDIKCS